jgi:phosphatidate cytidylyltransferase
MSSALRERVLTALALGALVVALLALLSPVAVLPIIAIVFLAGAWEWAGFGGFVTPFQRAAYVVGVALAMAAAWTLTSTLGRLTCLLWLAAGWWAAATLWLAIGPRRGGRRVAAAAGFAVLVPAALGLGRLVLFETHGRTLLLYLVVLVAAADVGAYFGGRSFGRHKLAPFVSPGKTWEGLAAGMLGSALAAAAGAVWLAKPLWPWMLLCVGVALVSVIGDLVESMFKRRAGLKDSGHVLPGHGGVLDRIDSLTSAGPAYVLALLVSGLA